MSLTVFTFRNGKVGDCNFQSKLEVDSSMEPTIHKLKMLIESLNQPPGLDFSHQSAQFASLLTDLDSGTNCLVPTSVPVSDPEFTPRILLRTRLPFQLPPNPNGTLHELDIFDAQIRAQLEDMQPFTIHSKASTTTSASNWERIVAFTQTGVLHWHVTLTQCWCFNRHRIHQWESQ